MPAFFYRTPRALLIQYLETNSHPHLAEWSTKDKGFFINLEEFYYKWLTIARPERFHYLEYLRGEFNREDFEEFRTCISGSAYKWARSGSHEYWTIVRKSTQKRVFVNNFVSTTLIGWIIQLLLEQTHVDWVQWTDKDNKQFQLLDITGLAKMYAKVQKTMTTTPSYYIKLLLSSYCSTGILIAVNKKNHCYQFNKEWYEKEMERKIEDNPKYNEDELIRISYIEFPDQTDFKKQYVL